MHNEENLIVLVFLHCILHVPLLYMYMFIDITVYYDLVVYIATLRLFCH